MGDLLDQPVLDQTTLPAVLALVAQLRAEVSQLRDDVARLQRDNQCLKQEVGYWKAMRARAIERLEATQQERDQLAGENLQLKADLFGRRCEKSSTLDRTNDLEDPQLNRPVRRRGQQPQRPGPKRRDYSTCPFARNASNFQRTNAAARAATLPSWIVTPRIPSRSRSRPKSIGE